MFNKKEMKLITDYKKAQQYLMNGVSVFMVQMDGSLDEVTMETPWQTLLFHNLKGGIYAIYRKKFTLGTFCKGVNIGRWSFTVRREEKGGEC